jgi:hypothetical protein
VFLNKARHRLFDSGPRRLVAVRPEVPVGVSVVFADAWRRRCWTTFTSAPDAIKRDA